MNFFRKSIEYHKLAQAFSGLYIMVNETETKIKNPYIETPDAESDLSFLAFIARNEILDRLDEFNWDMMSPIYIPNISNGKITITFAFQQTVGRLFNLSSELGNSDVINEILDRGKRYYELEMTIPEEARKKLF